ncbi:hypothetical protein I4U23_003563 [Adineta vaga]|nr:hypothetical protein I4U23_003563 [Adineta vaga]
MPIQTIYIILCYFFLKIQCKSIPFINNAVLIPIRPILNTTRVSNMTCDQCICSSLQNSSILALNCYANFTCELFIRYPRTYTYQSMNNSRVYFPQNIFPNASNPCCMSNTTLLLQKLQNASNRMINVTVTKPRCLLLDDTGVLVTIEQTSTVPSYLDRFDPQTLTLLEHISINASVGNIAYFQQKYYIGITTNQTISVFTSNGNNSLKYITNINSLVGFPMNGVRDIIFLDNGSKMVVASADNNRIYYFSLINNTNYQMTTYSSVNYGAPHGLFKVNDTYFYVASWSVPSIYGYKYIETTSDWTQTLFVSAPTTLTYGSHVLIDDCNRRWFTVYDYGLRIYSANGISLGNWSMDKGYFDTLFLDNYVMILSNSANNKIIRIDPQITCDEN